MSCIASFEDWFCLFRTWSFTLCKNDLDPNDNILILLRCKNSSYRFQQWILSVCCTVTTGRPALSSINSSLEKTKFYQLCILSSLMSTRRQRVSPFYRTSQFADSEEIDFHVLFSPGFLMQLKVACQESFRCIARPNSSSASILLWLFLHLNLLRSFRHYFRIICRTEMANVKQTQKMNPFFTCEISSN